MVIDVTKKTDDNEKILYFDAKNCYGSDMGESLPYDEIKFDRNVELEVSLNTPGDIYFGYFVAIDLRYSDEIKEKIEYFHFVLKIKN